MILCSIIFKSKSILELLETTIIFTLIPTKLFKNLQSIILVDKLYLISCGGSKSSLDGESRASENDN